MWKQSIAVAVCAAVVDVTAAHAQAPAETLVTATAILSIHERGHGGGPREPGPIGGGAPGIVIGVRLPIGTQPQLAVEASVQRGLKRRQSATDSFLTSHRDQLISVLATWKQPRTGRAIATPVAGGTVGWRHTARTSLLRPLSTELNDTVIGAVGGVDGRIQVSSRLSVMPGFRVHYLFDRDRNGDGTVRRGIGSLITRMGVGVGIAF